MKSYDLNDQWVRLANIEDMFQRRIDSEGAVSAGVSIMTLFDMQTLFIERTCPSLITQRKLMLLFDVFDIRTEHIQKAQLIFCWLLDNDMIRIYEGQLSFIGFVYQLKGVVDILQPLCCHLLPGRTNVFIKKTFLLNNKKIKTKNFIQDRHSYETFKETLSRLIK